jgi:hypothetical protein
MRYWHANIRPLVAVLPQAQQNPHPHQGRMVQVFP